VSIPGWQEIVALLLLPPGSLILIAMLGFLIYSKWTWAGSVVIITALALLIALSLPRTGQQLMASLEAYATPLDADGLDLAREDAKAIVVLAGGRYANAPEFGGDTVSRRTLERLRYGVYLHRRAELPLLVSGGSVGGEKISEAELMQQVLEQDYKLAANWQEKYSRNTFENALESAELLRAASIEHVILVTHGYHMRRAIWSFEQMGVKVTAAPMGLTTLGRRGRTVHAYLPSARGLYLSGIALREHLGYLWYQLAYRNIDSAGQAQPAATPGSEG
jgi:uncharacterized SAM-binding protein YcdF (DUF218 family)